MSFLIDALARATGQSVGGHVLGRGTEPLENFIWDLGMRMAQRKFLGDRAPFPARGSDFVRRKQSVFGGSPSGGHFHFSGRRAMRPHAHFFGRGPQFGRRRRKRFVRRRRR